MIGANTHSLKAVEVINPPKREMRRMEADAEERIAAALDKWRRDITRGMTADNAAFIVSRIRQRDVYQPFYDSIIAVLRDIALEGAGFGRRQIETAVLGISKGIFDIDWELANMAAERWARRFGAQLIRGVTDTTRQRVADTVADWTTNNESIGQLAKRLAEPGGPFGLNRARTIAVTETTRAYAEGNMAAWKESKVIKQRRWNTNVDEVVCPTCGPLHNVVAGLNEEFRAGNIVMSEPPAHPNCRCWITPVVEGAEERETGLGQFGLGPVVERGDASEVAVFVPQNEATLKKVLSQKQFSIEQGEKVDRINSAIKDEGIVNIQVPSNVFPQMVLGDEQRFLNQHATGTSKGILNNTYRAKAEEVVFGIPSGSAPSQYPVYGYVTTPGVVPRGVQQYGDLAITLKPNARRRSAFSIGDSLTASYEGNMVPAPVLAPHRAALSRNSRVLDNFHFSADESAESIIKKVNNTVGYIEAQVFGDVTLADIESVTLGKYGVLSPQVVDVLIKAGVKIVP
jgi:SPP1 gp7 family putative phage head morphogenesis protein